MGFISAAVLNWTEFLFHSFFQISLSERKACGQPNDLQVVARTTDGQEFPAISSSKVEAVHSKVENKVNKWFQK